MKNPGQAKTEQKRQEALVPLAHISDQIHEADLSIEALIELLTNSQKPVAPDGIVRLLRPHQQALRQAADALAHHT